MAHWAVSRGAGHWVVGGREEELRVGTVVTVPVNDRSRRPPQVRVEKVVFNRFGLVQVEVSDAVTGKAVR